MKSFLTRILALFAALLLCTTALAEEGGSDAAKALIEAGEYAQALALLTEESAEDADAQFSIALCYDKLGRNEEAVEQFRKAAELGSIDGAYYLGFLLDNGIGVDENDEEAAVWYLKAAEAGNAQAMEKIAYAYAEGQGVPQDTEQSEQWYRQAAEAGNVYSMKHLGYVCEHAEEPDYDQAVAWYEKAVEGGDAEAMTYLGVIYQCRQEMQDFEKAMTLYLQAAALGNAEAMHRLGELYEFGHGVQADEVAAEAWYEQSAKGDSPQAYYHLAGFYRDGRVVARDVAVAESYYRKAMDRYKQVYALPLTDAVNGLADLYSFEGYDYLHIPEAIALYTEAAEGGNVYAMKRLGGIYSYEAFADTLNLEKATEWYRKAVESGDTEAPALLEALENRAK